VGCAEGCTVGCVVGVKDGWLLGCVVGRNKVGTRALTAMEMRALFLLQNVAAAVQTVSGTCRLLWRLRNTR
jgi:hypothetical protein